MMETVVDGGTGKAAQIPAIGLLGKRGRLKRLMLGGVILTTRLLLALWG
jgi:hypothetical protein